MNLRHSCETAAKLLSQRIDEPLGLYDTLRLHLHLSLCRNCRNVSQQLEQVHTLSEKLFSGGCAPNEYPTPSDEAHPPERR